MSIVPDPSFVWLVGPSGSGKTTWAEAHFRDVEIVSSDHLRSIVGSGPNDLEASPAAFDVLERIARARLERGLMTVVDTLGFDDALRGRLAEAAARSGVEPIAVIFDTPPETCRQRNQARDRSVPVKVLRRQFKRFAAVAAGLEESGWPTMAPDTITVLSEPIADVMSTQDTTSDPPRGGLEFHLHISALQRLESPADLIDVFAAAEESGFSGLSVMDHLIQIPQVGPAWDDVADPYITLAQAASVTDVLRLGVLVSNVTLRPAAVLAKMIATLDHLSGGRMDCGLGAGWFAAEQTERGIEFPADRKRLDLLEDTIGALRRFWGPGGKPFEGRVLHIADSGMYPRPVQARIPIIVGGGGERRTLKIVAEHADGCNLRTGPDLDHKLEVLAAHCADAGRNLEDLLVTVLDVTLTGSSRDHVATLVERHRGNRSSRDFRSRTSAGTIEEQVIRYGTLRDSGVDRVYVSLIDLDGPEPVRRFGEVIEAFEG